MSATLAARSVRRDVKVSRDPWAWGTFAVSILVAVPLFAVVWLAFNPAENIWPHLAATILPIYLRDTFILLAGVGTGTFVIGTGTAWLVTMCRFPGQRAFEWALLLPLAMPTYITAYAYVDFLEYAGPVQVFLRNMFGWESAADYWFPPIRSLGGAVTVMTAVLYPYVYLTARAAFLHQSVCVLEVSRTLGRGAWSSFVAVALPLGRPAIVIGLSLVLMETLNDFGAVDYFAVKSLTAGVFDVWLGMGNLGGAAQIALVLLGFVIVLIVLERVARRDRRFHHTSARIRPLPGYSLTPLRAIAATIACALPVVLGFAIPGGVLLRMALNEKAHASFGDFLGYAGNSLILACLAGAAALVVGIVLAYGVRTSRTRLVLGAARFASVGYAIPGAVLAVGVLIPLAAFDNAVDAAARAWFGVSTGLLISGSMAILVYAYLVRFLALSYGAVESGLARVTPAMDMVARTLGQGTAGTLVRVHLPIVRGSLLTAALLVFVDSMKELPATLILRPFNFDTLATHVYTYASLEQIEESALAALAIVVVGLLPVILLSRTVARSRPGMGEPRETDPVEAAIEHWDPDDFDAAGVTTDAGTR